MTIHSCYVGCDISKAHLDIFDPQDGRVARIANRPDAIASYLGSLSGRDVFFVFEATGGYDRALRFALAAAGVPGARINPTAAKRFAQATGAKAKTDALDARMLSNLGARLTPAADPAPCEKRERLGLLHKRRDQLVEMRKGERTRLKELDDAFIIASVREVIDKLEAMIARLEAEITALIADEADMRRATALMQTAPGVGPVTAVTLTALMPELGRVSPKRIASLAGLAPFNHDSGVLRGRRCISGGRRRVRHALYMAALGAIRRCERYRRLYEDVATRAGAKKVAIIAVARKLLTHLNAMIRDQKQWA